MKKIITYLLPLIILIISCPLNAQQNSLFNTYSMDPLQLNIAYAGAVCTEANVHYRTQWIGLKDAPKLIQLNAHTALGKTNALGLKVNSQTQGLLNTLQATAGYSYRFRITETAKMHLGIGLGWTQAALNSQKAVVMDANDVTLNNNNRQTANGFDSEFGAMVIGQKLKAGISVLHLYNTNPDFTGTNAYKTLPQFNTQVSYIFNKGKNVEVEPWLLNRYTIKGNNVMEGMVNVNFMQTITVGAGYRNNYGIMGLLGAKVGNVKLAYSFDYGTTKNATSMGSSHQVMLGFSLCKASRSTKSGETLEPVEPKELPVTATVAPVTEPVKEDVPVKDEVKKEEIKQEDTKQEEIKPEEPQKIVLSRADEKKQILELINKIAEKTIFELNKSELDASGLKNIDDIAVILKDNPDVVVNVLGHTCNLGSDETNSLLSQKRSLYVKEQLIKRGVITGNIKESKGLGAEKPLFDNNSELQSKNRTIRFELAQ